MAELWGLLQGLDLAWQRGFRKIDVELDSTLVVDLMKKYLSPLHPLHSLVDYFWSFLHRNWSLRFRQIYREANGVVDSLADCATSLPLDTLILDAPPASLHQRRVNLRKMVDSTSPPNDDEAPRRIHFEFKKKDLESDESIWALYENWCLHYQKSRTPQEMQERFHYFKKKIKRVYEHNTSNKWSYEIGLNIFGDGDRPCGCCRDMVDPRRTRSHFEFDKGDLESDDKLWALYEKWCLHEEIRRTGKEMVVKVFPVFKKNAEAIYEHNVMCPNSRLDLGVFGDHEDSSWVRRYVNLISSI